MLCNQNENNLEFHTAYFKNDVVPSKEEKLENKNKMAH